MIEYNILVYWLCRYTRLLFQRRHNIPFMSPHTLWRHDDFFDVMTYRSRIFDVSFFDVNTDFFDVIWRTFDVMPCIWLHNERVDVMTCFWRHDELFDVLTCLLAWLWRHDLIFYRQNINFCITWCFDVIFWCHDVTNPRKYPPTGPI